MMPTLLALLAFGFSALLAEIILRGEKLQSRIAFLTAFFGAAGLGVAVALLYRYQVDPVLTAIFWAGCFLSWFGIRSHIESSILLRLLYLLRKGPTEESELLKQYELDYGRESRVEELFRARLIRTEGKNTNLTSRGIVILRIADHLK